MIATPPTDLLYRGLSYDIQGAAFEVYRELGPGMLVIESCVVVEVKAQASLHAA